MVAASAAILSMGDPVRDNLPAGFLLGAGAGSAGGAVGLTCGVDGVGVGAGGVDGVGSGVGVGTPMVATIDATAASDGKVTSGTAIPGATVASRTAATLRTSVLGSATTLATRVAVRLCPAVS